MEWIFVAYLFLAGESEPYVEVIDVFDNEKTCRVEMQIRQAEEHWESKTVYDCFAYAEDV